MQSRENTNWSGRPGQVTPEPLQPDLQPLDDFGMRFHHIASFGRVEREVVEGRTPVTPSSRPDVDQQLSVPHADTGDLAKTDVIDEGVVGGDRSFLSEEQ